jgi:hypothetical protein
VTINVKSEGYCSTTQCYVNHETTANIIDRPPEAFEIVKRRIEGGKHASHEIAVGEERRGEVRWWFRGGEVRMCRRERRGNRRERLLFQVADQGG